VIRLLSLISVFNPFHIQCFSQDYSTVEEIFNFEIGDRFHSRFLSPAPPNALRVKILNRYYSDGQDSIFYIRAVSRYFCFDYQDPESGNEDCQYEDYVDTISYTHLDSFIYSNPDLMYFEPDRDDLSYHMEQDTLRDFCDLPIERFIFFYGSDGLGDTYTYEFSPGLGQVYFQEYLGGGFITENSLFYFKKGEMECGTPDLTPLEKYIDPDESIISVYPNPATDIINVHTSESLSPINAHYFIFDSSGELCLMGSLSNLIEQINISNLNKGIYCLKINDRGNTINFIKL
jgi:hypothetical protein